MATVIGTDGRFLYYSDVDGEHSISLFGGGFPYQNLVDASYIVWNITQSVSNAILVLGGNRTLSFTGVFNGCTGVLLVKQPSSGGPWTLNLPPQSKVVNGGGGSIALSSSANAVDILAWSFDGTNYYWTYGLNYS